MKKIKDVDKKKASCVRLNAQEVYSTWTYDCYIIKNLLNFLMKKKKKESRIESVIYCKPFCERFDTVYS